MTDTVTIDAHFARFGAKRYAINKINSVEVREHRPKGNGGIWLCGLIALICLLSFLGSLSMPDGPNFGVLALGALFGFLTYQAWLSSQIREYQLFPMTSSSEAQAYVSRDADEVARLRQAIENAMAAS